jgi:cytoplasmic iron level regulating protein YaaA (DUF328/UPF0246 family)
VLVLLPPSESKSAPAARGKPVDLDALSFPGLTPTRTRVLDALAVASAAPDALRRLDAGPSLAPEVERNARLRDLPARPALEVYTGVLYDALGWPTLSTSARRRAGSRLVVVSALWGALRPADRVPPYRLNMCGDLGLGSLTQLWRPVLTRVLADAAPKGLVVDCRSGDYVAACPSTGELARRTVAVRVLQEGRTGRTVVSHAAKHTRGEVTRYLLETGADPARPQGLARVLGERWAVELTPPPRPGRPWTIDVVLPVPSSP